MFVRRLTAALAACAIVPASFAQTSPPAIQDEGEAFFPLGWFDARLWDSAQEAADAYAVEKAQGMNTVMLAYSNWWYPIDRTVQVLDGAHANDMKVIVELQRHSMSNWDLYLPLPEIGQQVQAIKDHPALLAYDLVDEPDLYGITIEDMQNAYAHIRTFDPDTPVMAIHWAAWVGGDIPAQTYLEGEPPIHTDILAVNNYPIRPEYPDFPPAGGRNAWWVAASTRIGVQLVEEHNKEGYIHIVQTHEKEEWNLLQPTYDELRYMSYAPIVEGARGLLYWAMPDGGFNGTTPEFKDNVVAPVALEISSLIPAILNGSSAVAVFSTHDTATTGIEGHFIEDVTYLFIEDDHRGYLIAVNNTPYDIANVQFTLDGSVLDELAEAGLIPVLFEDRDVALAALGNSTYTITDDFTAYGVNVYQLWVPEPVSFALLLAPAMCLLRRRR